jgi:hypothetical protein
MKESSENITSVVNCDEMIKVTFPKPAAVSGDKVQVFPSHFL